MIENASLVSHDRTITNKLPFATTAKLLDFTIKQISATDIVPKNETVSHSVIREAFRNTSVPPEIASLITDSWRTATKNRYESVLKTMDYNYATLRNTDPYTAYVTTVLAFLHRM